MTLAQGLILAAFALIHVLAGRLRFLDVIPRSRWLSFAGGTAVAYALLHLLPELSRAQADLLESGRDGIWARHGAYLTALAGLVIFYGLERMVKRHRRPDSAPAHQQGGETAAPIGVFWLHIGSFALYNALIAYLLVIEGRRGPGEQALFAIALGLHFLVNDFGLRQAHRDTYRRIGRWLLAAALLLGAMLASVVALPEAATGLLFALLAGGIIMNVLKEELPEERESRFSAFLLGVSGYAALLALL